MQIITADNFMMFVLGFIVSALYIMLVQVIIEKYEKRQNKRKNNKKEKQKGDFLTENKGLQNPKKIKPMPAVKPAKDENEGVDL